MSSCQDFFRFKFEYLKKVLLPKKEDSPAQGVFLKDLVVYVTLNIYPMIGVGFSFCCNWGK